MLVNTDNTTVMTYINKQGGHILHPYVFWSGTCTCTSGPSRNNIALTAQHIVGKANILADHLSRKSKILPTEWMFNKAVVQTIFNMWERPQIDLFATRWNSDHCVSISRRTSTISGALSVDALSLIWQGIVGYANPPVTLIPKILQKIQLSNCIIILIAPFWTRQPWFPDLAQLFIDYPMKLPVLQNLISQQKGRFHHPNVEMLKLTAWKLSANIP